MKRNRTLTMAISYSLALVCGIFLVRYLEAFNFYATGKEAFSRFPLFADNYNNIIEFRRHLMISGILYVPLIFGFFGAVLFREWGRKIILFTTGICFLYVAYRTMFILNRMDSLSLINLVVYAGIAVFFSFPRVKEQFAQRTLASEKRILIVDDDRGLLKMLDSTLTKKGYFIYTATSGEEGLQVAKEDKPHLIILDVLMPSMKGREVCKRLKEDDQTKDIPIVFLTAKDSPDDIRAEMEAGALTHITKPVDTQDLIAIVADILNV